MKTTKGSLHKGIFLSAILGFLMVSSCQKGNELSDAYGNFEAVSVYVSPEVSGKILHLELEEGQRIEQGPLIAIIDTMNYYLLKEDLLAQKKAVNARVDNLSAQAQTFKVQLNSLEIEINRAEKLIKDGAATEQMLDDLYGKRNVLTSQINAVNVQKIAIQAEIKVLEQKELQASDKFERCFIYNPVEGTVLEKYVEENEMAMVGKPLYKVADLSTLELKVYVAGTDLQWVKLGEEVRVFLDRDIHSNKEISGRVTWISSQAEFTPKIIQTKKERVNLVYAVKILVRNDGTIKIGMPGEAVFPDKNREEL